MSKQITVSIEQSFIIEAHKAACQVWKSKLEEKFPEVFKLSQDERTLEMVKDVIGDHPYGEKGSNMFVKNDILAIQLPNANRAWTYWVWDSIKTLCEKDTTMFPLHGKHYNDIISEHPNYDPNCNYAMVDVSYH